MSEQTYTLQPGEKATPVMIGTSDLLIWGNLVTKEAVRVDAFLITLAEAFVPIHEAKILFLAPAQQTAPVDRPVVYIKLEEILLFYAMADQEPLPEETEVRRYEPVEAIVGSFQIEGTILKSPIATLQNLLLVSKEEYTSIYQAKIRDVAKPWLGTFASNTVLVRRDRLTIAVR
jgi:hypothetical protein